MADRTLRDRLIGAWTLVSYEEQPVDDSESFYPMGRTPKAIIMYTPDGETVNSHLAWRRADASTMAPK